jgi:hypothetical protein
LSAIEGLKPCRLSFVTGTFLTMQVIFTSVLLLDVCIANLDRNNK